jgi:diamine N-acetyltransferase
MSKATAHDLTLRPVTRDNWRAVRDLRVADDQRTFVADPNHYLAVCCYESWSPLAICLDDTVIGFMMWAVDPDDRSCWFGGIFLDRAYQGRGLGRAAIVEALAVLGGRTGASEFALSYQPANTVARRLYGSLGFVETGEVEDDEVVARLRV